jgi:hypothetical protein
MLCISHVGFILEGGVHDGHSHLCSLCHSSYALHDPVNIKDNLCLYKYNDPNPRTLKVELRRMPRVDKCYDHSSNPVDLSLSHIFYYSYRILLEQTLFPSSHLKS